MSSFLIFWWALLCLCRKPKNKVPKMITHKGIQLKSAIYFLLPPLDCDCCKLKEVNLMNNVSPWDELSLACMLSRLPNHNLQITGMESVRAKKEKLLRHTLLHPFRINPCVYWGACSSSKDTLVNQRNRPAIIAFAQLNGFCRTQLLNQHLREFHAR